ncbi:hypothetical protein STEG23_008002, partial [Scotinomys teguina]
NAKELFNGKRMADVHDNMIRFSVSGFMFLSLIYLDLSFMHGNRDGSLCILLHTGIQISQDGAYLDPSPLLTSAQGTGRYSEHYQRRKLNTNPDTNQIYNSGMQDNSGK